MNKSSQLAICGSFLLLVLFQSTLATGFSRPSSTTFTTATSSNCRHQQLQQQQQLPIMPTTTSNSAPITTTSLGTMAPDASSSNNSHNNNNDTESEPLLSSRTTTSSNANSSVTASIGESSSDGSSTNTNDNHKKGLLGALSRIDYLLLFYFALFYAGNYGYSVTNKLAVKEAMYPLTISTMNFGLGAISYVPVLWMTRLRPIPWSLTGQDLLRILPVAILTAGSHTASVFGYAHGSVSFVNIVKTAEPVFCALLSQFGGYGQSVSMGKWLTLPIIISGVVLASKNEYSFSWFALCSACIANLIAAIRSNETKSLLQTQGLQERLQGASNQFAITAALGFLCLLPCSLIVEGRHYGTFWQQLQTSSTLWQHVAWASVYFYGYNELRTLTLKQTSAVTGSIANTLKRVLIVIVVACVLKEHLTVPKLMGCLIAITGVFLYSTIDALVAHRSSSSSTTSANTEQANTSSTSLSSTSTFLPGTPAPDIAPPV